MIFIKTENGSYINTNKIIAYSLTNFNNKHKITADFGNIDFEFKIATFEDKKTAEKVLKRLIDELISLDARIQSGNVHLKPIIDIEEIKRNVKLS